MIAFKQGLNECKKDHINNEEETKAAKMTKTVID